MKRRAQRNPMTYRIALDSSCGARCDTSSATSSVRKLSPHTAAIDYSTTCDPGALVQLDVGLLNNRGESFALLAGEVCKGLAGKAGELDGKGVEAFADIRFLADGIQFRGQLVDNRLRHADRSDPSEPSLHLEALEHLRDGRNIRREGVALGRGDCECTDFPSLDLFPGGREVIASDLDLTADKILHLLVRGPVSYAIHPDTGGLHQHLAAKVLARAVAGCGVRLIWIGLNPGDELREASCRDGGMHYKHVGLNSHQVKIGEVLVGVVAEVFLHDRRIDGKASGGANADRVTVRCGLRQARDADYTSLSDFRSRTAGRDARIAALNKSAREHRYCHRRRRGRSRLPAWTASCPVPRPGRRGG